jgi:hypothetical protein
MKKQKNNQPESLREELLREAAEKPIRKFKQYDVFFHNTGSDMFDSDKDGDNLSSGQTYELNRSACLRVLVPSGTTPEEVMRGLKKVIVWIKGDSELLNWNWGYMEEKPSFSLGNQVIEPEIGMRYADNTKLLPIIGALEMVKDDRGALDTIIKAAQNLKDQKPQDDDIPF